MSKKTAQIVIGLLVLMNGISLFFLFRPQKHPHHFRKPPSIIDVLDIEGKNVNKIKELETIHFNEKGKLMDEIRVNKRKVYSLIGKKHNKQTLDSLLSFVNSKNYQAEKMTFDYFQKIRMLLPKSKQKELDSFVQNVIANHPGPPKR